MYVFAELSTQVHAAVSKHIDLSVIKVVLVGSPGFVAADFCKHMFDAAVRHDERVRVQGCVDACSCCLRATLGVGCVVSDNVRRRRKDVQKRVRVRLNVSIL